MHLIQGTLARLQRAEWLLRTPHDCPLRSARSDIEEVVHHVFNILGTLQVLTKVIGSQLHKFPGLLVVFPLRYAVACLENVVVRCIGVGRKELRQVERYD
jgi:hypothetical protein